MFQICFGALVVASLCAHHLDDKVMIKYGDLYYDRVGLIGGGKANGKKAQL